MTIPIPTGELHVFNDGAHDGPTNMARDEALLYSPLTPASLRIYGWTPATISLGYFQRFDAVSELPEDVRGLAVVRRPTGGGAILHDREITYCLIVDETLPIARKEPAALYRLVHEVWRDVMNATGTISELAPDSMPLPSPRSGPFFCFEKPGKTDLIVGDAKLLGSAQRRVTGRVLQHGSLLLAQRFASHPGVNLGEPPAEVVQGWVRDAIERVAAALNLTPTPGEWTSALLADVAVRREKYASDAWNRLR